MVYYAHIKRAFVYYYYYVLFALDEGGNNVVVKQMIVAPDGREPFVFDLTGDWLPFVLRVLFSCKHTYSAACRQG